MMPRIALLGGRPLCVAEVITLCTGTTWPPLIAAFPPDYLVLGERTNVVLVASPDLQVVAHLPLLGGKEPWVDAGWQQREAVRRHLVGVPSVPVRATRPTHVITMPVAEQEGGYPVMVIPRWLSLGELRDLNGPPDFLSRLRPFPGDYQLSPDYQGMVIIANRAGDSVARIDLQNGGFWESPTWRTRQGQYDQVANTVRDLIERLRSQGAGEQQIMALLLRDR